MRGEGVQPVEDVRRVQDGRFPRFALFLQEGEEIRADKHVQVDGDLDEQHNQRSGSGRKAVGAAAGLLRRAGGRPKVPLDPERSELSAFHRLKLGASAKRGRHWWQGLQHQPQ